jgi:hypothetical protein
MKKFLITALLLTSMLAHAEVDAKAMKVINDIQEGRDNNNQIKELRVAGDASIGGDVAVASVDAATATVLTVGAANATGVTVGASDAPTIVSGNLTVSTGLITATGDSAKIWLGTNGYFQVSAGALQFVGYNSFTNEVDADISQ